MVTRRQFRADLYYRLGGVDLRVPPLRERRPDIIELAEHFLERHRHVRALALSDGAREALLLHDWPGNVRELQRVIERSVALASGVVIELDDLPPAVRGDYDEVLTPSLRRSDTMRAWGSRYARLTLAAERFDIAALGRLAHAIDMRLERRDVAGEPRCRDARSGFLESSSHKENVALGGCLIGIHEAAAPRLDGDEARHFEAAQGFAHRHLAGPELRRELQFEQALARHIMAVDDAGDQDVADAGSKQCCMRHG